MCITSSKSILDNTYIGVWDIDHPDFGYRHVLSYQNRVKNLSDEPNCMLLHIQSKEGIQPEWLIDTTDYKDFLTELYEIIDPTFEEEGNWMSASREIRNYVVEMGVYHIAILNDLSESGLEASLSQIPSEKLPAISLELISFFKNHFPDFPLLLCCFNNKDALQAAPIMVHYPPKHPEKLMANTLDSHGGLPQVGEEIHFHQKIVFGSYKSSTELKRPYVEITEPDKELLLNPIKEFLPKFISAFDFEGTPQLPNKDICIEIDSIRKMETPKASFVILGKEKQSNEMAIHDMGRTFYVRGTSL